MFELIYRFDPSRTEEYKVPRTAEEARRSLMQGNRDFVEVTDLNTSATKTRVINFDPRAFGWGISSGESPAQAPFAAVLGCADARVPTEMVFGKGCNELFVVRVAGNVLGQECLGSLRYAAGHFPGTLKLVVVLAHAKCGAVTEAVDVYLEPRRYMNLATDSSIRSIADQILVSVRAAALGLETLYGGNITRQPGCRAALLETAVVLNAAWTAYCLREEFSTKSPDLGVVFGAYDLVSRHVRLPLSPPAHVTEEEIGLFPPPLDIEGFRQLAYQICSGRLVRSHLGVEDSDRI